jgi:tetratricopeptide (TPR) repeat protein
VIEKKLLQRLKSVNENESQDSKSHSNNIEAESEFLKYLRLPQAEQLNEDEIQRASNLYSQIRKSNPDMHPPYPYDVSQFKGDQKAEKFFRSLPFLVGLNESIELERDGVAVDELMNTKVNGGLTYNDMGSSLFQKRKYHDSVTIFNEALNFMPQDSGIYINRGDAYRELKKFNLALSDYHYAIDLGGDSKMIKARLSLTHYALGS